MANWDFILVIDRACLLHKKKLRLITRVGTFPREFDPLCKAGIFPKNSSLAQEVKFSYESANSGNNQLLKYKCFIL